MAKLLVLEDFPPVAGAIARALRRLGHQVVVCTAVRHALAQFEAFDCAVVDIELPDGSGVDAAQTLIATGKAGWAVFFSGCRDEELVRRAAELGPIVDKAEGAERLCAVVTDILRRPAAEAVAVGDESPPPIAGGHLRRSGTRRVIR